MKLFKISAVLISFLFLYGCGASTASRYDKDEDKEEKIKTEEISEDIAAPPMDMTPYHSRFNFDVPDYTYEGEIWYGYDSVSSDSELNLVDADGYRVEVMATDDLEEANNMRSELRFRIRNNVYIIFDPPFYRVRIGDYETRGAAENQSFKMRQLGYQESRVVSDTVKIPERP